MFKYMNNKAHRVHCTAQVHRSPQGLHTSVTGTREALQLEVGDFIGETCSGPVMVDPHLAHLS